MKKFLFLSIACLILLAGNLNSQVIYQEDFEALTANQTITSQKPDKWVTPGTEESAQPKVTDLKAANGTKSLHMSQGTETFLKLGDLRNEKYSIEFKISVNTGKYANIPIFKEITAQSQLVGIQIIFMQGQIFLIKKGKPSPVEGFSYETDKWIEVKLLVDLDADIVTFYLDKKEIVQDKWSSFHNKPRITALSAILFQATDVPVQGGVISADYYIDDFKFEKLKQLAPVKNLSYTLENINDINLKWEAPEGEAPNEYQIRKDGNLLGTTTDLNYLIKSHLPGTFSFDVIADHGEKGKSAPTSIEVKIDAGVDRQYVVYEVLTSVKCTACPTTAKAIDEFALDKNNKIGVIEYHFDMTEEIKDPFSSTDFFPRADYYNLKYLPTLVVNGSPSSDPFKIDKNDYNQIIAEKSPLSITTTSKFLGSGKYSFNIKLKEELKINTEEIRFFAVLTETNIAHNWLYGLKHVNFVARKIYPNKKGKIISFNEKATIDESIEITIPGTYNSSNCELVIFAQDMKTGKILQADKVRIADINTSISAENYESNLNIYPNPAVDVLNIESSSIIDKVEILSIDGKLINSFNANDTKVECNTQNLVKGFYVVRIYQDNKITSERFVVK